MKYRLLYINDDETPELYMQAGDNSSLYTIVDDEAKPILEAKRQSDERLSGIRTRRGLFLTYSKDDEIETYTVNRLRNGEVSPVETYISEDGSYTIDGSSVDLVEFTQHVRAKQANYQFTGNQLPGSFTYLTNRVAVRFFSDNDLNDTGFRITWCASGTGIDNEDMGTTLYPNPASDVLHISFNEPVVEGVATIYDMVGNTVITQVFEQANDIEIPVNQLSNGIYLLSLKNGDRTIQKKIVINH
jgi:hypothetical protein